MDDGVPTLPALLRYNFNSVPKWTQLGIVQIGILSIHCILVLGTLVIVDHANITKPPPLALLPSYQYISIQLSHSIHFQTKIAAFHAEPMLYFGGLQKLYAAKIGKMCYECTQLGGLAEWFTQINTSQSLIEVHMPYTAP